MFSLTDIERLVTSERGAHARATLLSLALETRAQHGIVVRFERATAREVLTPLLAWLSVG